MNFFFSISLELSEADVEREEADAAREREAREEVDNMAREDFTALINENFKPDGML